MKIAIDISQTAFIGTGVARYTTTLIESLIQYNLDNHVFTFFFSSLRNKPSQHIKQLIKHPHTLKTYYLPPILLDFLWNKLHILPIEYLIGKQDLIITSDWTEPPVKYSKKITIIHDMVIYKYPETSTSKLSFRLKNFILSPNIISTQKQKLSLVKKESSLIIADSHSTKSDIIHYLNIPHSKIEVIYPPVVIASLLPNSIENTLSKHRLFRPFILTVGKLEPRKNIPNLISAFQQANLENTDLIIVGPSGWNQSKNLSYKENNDNSIRFMGYLPDEELYALYTKALFFIYPSLYEGFGYPIIEAMGLGCPVATSKTSSTGEIAEECALLFDPLSINDIRDTILILYKNKTLRNELIQKGLKHYANFSQKQFAKNIFNCINSLS